MKKNDLKIVYMGTPEFAVASLKTLVEVGYNVAAVVTMPDKPIGRGYKTQPSPVKVYAVEQGIEVLQPENLKDENFLEKLRQINADLQIVVAFRMLPQAVWAMPRLGTFNLHASLLPQYRGAAPINWAVINGEKETGVTTFFLKHEIDTGNIILQEKIKIESSDNAGSLHDKLMILGAKLVGQTVEKILSGKVDTFPQPENFLLKPAPKIFRQTCRLDFKQNVEALHNLVRGFAPYPGAWLEMKTAAGEVLGVKIFETECEFNSDCSQILGRIFVERDGFKISCEGGYLLVRELQISGKRRMKSSDFVRGFKDLSKCEILM